MNKLIIKATKHIPDRIYISLLYFKHFHRFPNLKNPKGYNEKIQWLKLYDRNPRYTTMVDKILVKDYVAKKIGSEHIIPTLAIWKKPEDINFDVLPNEFVLKWNHDSHSIIICKDKKNLDIESSIAHLKKGELRSGYQYGREWPYKDVRPMILAEKYMVNNQNESALIDYKVMCFNGEPKLIMVLQGRYSNSYTKDFYDINWNKLNLEQIGAPQSSIILEKPECLQQMIEFSRILSHGIATLRVDWYIIKEVLYFGELTFYDASGLYAFVPKEKELEIGSWIKLPEKH